MTKEEAIARLREAQLEKPNKDAEDAHLDADQVLCDLLTSLGYHEVVEEWEKIDKWYA